MSDIIPPDFDFDVIDTSDYSHLAFINLNIYSEDKSLMIVCRLEHRETLSPHTGLSVEAKLPVKEAMEKYNLETWEKIRVMNVGDLKYWMMKVYKKKILMGVSLDAIVRTGEGWKDEGDLLFSGPAKQGEKNAYAKPSNLSKKTRELFRGFYNELS